MVCTHAFHFLKYQYDLRIGVVVFKLFGSALRFLGPGWALLGIIQHFPPMKPHAGKLFDGSMARCTAGRHNLAKLAMPTSAHGFCSVHCSMGNLESAESDNTIRQPGICGALRGAQVRRGTEGEDGGSVVLRAAEGEGGHFWEC